MSRSVVLCPPSETLKPWTTWATFGFILHPDRDVSVNGDGYDGAAGKEQKCGNQRNPQFHPKTSFARS
jgi:hypothetical protein